MSSSSDDDEQGGISGFVWGNISEQTGKLDDVDVQRYPLDFQENLESDKVANMSHEMSSSIINRNDADDSFDAPMPSLSNDTAVSIRALSSGEEKMRDLALRRGQESDEDEEDWDMEEEESDVTKPIETGLDTTTLPKPPLPPPVASSTKVSPEPEDVIVEPPELPVLFRSTEGEVVLRFSELFAPAALPNVHRWWRKPPKLERQSAPLGFREGEMSLFQSETLPLQERVDDELDAEEPQHQQQQQSLRPKAWKNFDIGEALTSSHLHQLQHNLVPSAMSLVEQLNWEDDVLWNEPEVPQDAFALSTTNAAELQARAEEDGSHRGNERKSKRAAVEDAMHDEFLSDPEDNVVSAGRGEAAGFRIHIDHNMPARDQQKRKVQFSFAKRRRRRTAPLLTSGVVQQALSENYKTRRDTSWGFGRLNNADNTDPDEQKALSSSLSLNRGIEKATDWWENEALNDEFNRCNWLHNVVWDDRDTSSSAATPRFPLILDRNDRHMIFQSHAANRDESAGISLKTVQTRSAKAFDISNDLNVMYEGYREDLGAVVGKTKIQHALFAKDHARELFPTRRTRQEWRRWHRPQVKLTRSYSVRLCSKEKDISISQGKKFVPRKARELSARQGDIKLIEFIEERPLLVQSVGMVSELVTFYRERNEQDQYEPARISGDVLRRVSSEKDDETPFLGKIRAGQTIHALNNNLYGVGLAQHKVPKTDLLLVISGTRNVMYLREIPTLCIAGQIQPKLEVTAPNSRAQGKFMKKRLTVYIYQRLRESGKVQISEMFAAFPDQSETAIRAKLKDVATFQRSGAESGWWTPRLDQGVPRGSELHDMVPPEALCAYESMQAGKYHLADIGLEVLTLSPQLASVITKMKNENPLKRTALVIDQELRLSPWNLSENFLTASKGRCLLRLKGPGNPLGRGQALCYMRAPTRADPDPVEKKIGPVSALTGTNKDLRKLHMNELRDVLLSFGVPADHIEKLLRWERVRLVREKVSEATRQGEETQYGRFARANRNTYRSLNKQFLRDAQRILERQCEVLASEVIDEDEEHSNTDEEMDEWAKDLENMLDEEEQEERSKKKTNEEDEQKEYERFMREQRGKKKANERGEEERVDSNQEASPSDKQEKKKSKKVLKRVLKKTVRTMQPDGSEVTKVTILTDSALVKAFELDQKDSGGRLHRLMKEKSVVDVVKRKRRLVGDKKRRRPMKHSGTTATRWRDAAANKERAAGKHVIGAIRMVEKTTLSVPKKRGRPKGSKNKPKAESEPQKKRTKARCSACGQVGHTKLNKRCPMRANENAAAVVSSTDTGNGVELTSAGTLLLYKQNAD